MTQLIVDLVQLRDTCQAVRADTNKGLRDGLADADPKVHQGVPFGKASPSGEINAARDALKATLHRHAENGTAHLGRADQIVRFLAHMLGEYETADSIQAATMEQILTELDHAFIPPRNPSASGFQE
jgi:hypothetical protein